MSGVVVVRQHRGGEALVEGFLLLVTGALGAGVVLGLVARGEPVVKGGHGVEVHEVVEIRLELDQARLDEVRVGALADLPRVGELHLLKSKTMKGGSADQELLLPAPPPS